MAEVQSRDAAAPRSSRDQARERWTDRLSALMELGANSSLSSPRSNPYRMICWRNSVMERDTFWIIGVVFAILIVGAILDHLFGFL
jgi:hypothetical protein